jgi:hypothetical protein
LLLPLLLQGLHVELLRDDGELFIATEFGDDFCLLLMILPTSTFSSLIATGTDAVEGDCREDEQLGTCSVVSDLSLSRLSIDCMSTALGNSLSVGDDDTLGGSFPELPTLIAAPDGDRLAREDKDPARLTTR